MSLTGVYFLLTNIYLNEDDDDDEEEKERTKREEKKKGHLGCRKKIRAGDLCESKQKKSLSYTT